MYSIKLMIFVSLCLIILAESSDPLTIKTARSTVNSTHQIFNLVENQQFYLLVENLLERITQDCTGNCSINNKTLGLACEVVQQNQAQFLNVSIKHNVTKDLSGKWKCDFVVIKVGTTRMQTTISNHFELNVTTLPSIDSHTWMYIGLGILAFIIVLVFVTQTYCIIRYKRKAKAIKRDAQWHKNKERNEDTTKTVTVRYSKMPGLKKTEVLIPDARESGIYEDLEAIQRKVAPVPPSVESLPRKKKSKVPEPPVPALEIQMSAVTDSPAPSPKWNWNSLLKKKIKKYEESESESNNSTLDKRTTLDRIKERPPLPVPNDGDIYEDVKESPQPARKDININLPREKLQHRKPKPAIPLPTNEDVMPPLNSQLKQALENRNCLSSSKLQPPKTKNTSSNTLPKEPIKQNTTLQPKKLKQWHNESTLLKTKTWANQEPTPTTDWSREPTAKKAWPREPTTPKDWQTTATNAWSKEPTTTKSWQKKPKMSKPKDWPRATPQDQEEPPRVKESQRPKVTPSNPGLPPTDAPPAKIITPWGESIVKSKPPPPVKPKQLHPLPGPPSESKSLPPEHGSDSDDSESEWTYEPLPKYNIYSI